MVGLGPDWLIGNRVGRKSAAPSANVAGGLRFAHPPYEGTIHANRES